MLLFCMLVFFAFVDAFVDAFVLRVGLVSGMFTPRRQSEATNLGQLHWSTFLSFLLGHWFLSFLLGCACQASMQEVLTEAQSAREPITQTHKQKKSGFAARFGAEFE